MTSVLYDHPGPKARVRSRIYGIVFIALLLLGAWWIIDTLDAKGELVAEKWDWVLTADAWQTYLLPGLWNTIKAAVLSLLIALPFGMLLAVGRLSDHKWIKLPVGAFVEFFRAIPVVLLMLFMNELAADYMHMDSEIRPLFAVVSALVLYNASVLCEIFRAGIWALPKGQTEAAVAIGLRKSQLMALILLPQVITSMLPAIISQLVVTLKDTALGAVLVNYEELMRTVSQLTSTYFSTVGPYVVIAAIYIALNFALSTGATQLDRWIRRRRLGTDTPSALGPAGAPALPIPGSVMHGDPGDTGTDVGRGGTV